MPGGISNAILTLRTGVRKVNKNEIFNFCKKVFRFKTAGQQSRQMPSATPKFHVAL